MAIENYTRNFLFKIERSKAGGMTQEVECLSSTHKALSSNPSTTATTTTTKVIFKNRNDPNMFKRVSILPNYHQLWKFFRWPLTFKYALFNSQREGTGRKGSMSFGTLFIINSLSLK
jgi:hypothetical protein